MSVLSESLHTDFQKVVTDFKNLEKEGKVNLSELTNFIVFTLEVFSKIWEQLGTTPAEQKQNILDIAGDLFDSVIVVEIAVLPPWAKLAAPAVNKMAKEVFLQFVGEAFDKFDRLGDSHVTLAPVKAA